MTTVSTDYETMFRDLFPRLVSLGVVMTGRRDIAHELAQETLLRAHRRWDEVSRYDAPAAWCRKVMVNLVIDHQRSAASERRAVERLAPRRPATSTARRSPSGRASSPVCPNGSGPW